MEIWYRRNEFNSNLIGNKELSLKKVYSIVRVCCEKVEKLTKTKLAKFLWYIDFLAYKETNEGITGLSYCHLPYGAVPYMYEDILNSDLIEMNVIYKVDSMTCLLKKCNVVDVLDEKEHIIVDRVLAKFKNMNTKEVVNYMHNEKGYLETRNNEYISYLYAKDIQF